MQQALEGGEALRHPFGVVEPVHAEDQLLVGEQPPQPRDRFSRARSRSESSECVRVGADRVDAYAAPLRTVDERVADLGAAKLLDQRVHQVAGVAASLQAHQVVDEEVLQQLPRPRQDREGVDGRKRDVQEEADLSRPSELSKCSGEREEVEVVDPQGVVGPQMGRQALGESSVDPPVGGVRLASYVNPVRVVVQQRPQRSVGKDVVVQAGLAPRQVECDHAPRAEVRNGDVAAVAGRGRPAAPAEPQRLSLTENGTDGAYQTAHLACGEVAVAAQVLRRRQSVRDEYNALRGAHRLPHVRSVGRTGAGQTRFAVSTPTCRVVSVVPHTPSSPRI